MGDKHLQPPTQPIHPRSQPLINARKACDYSDHTPALPVESSARSALEQGLDLITNS